MNILILYTSRGGATKACVDILKKKLTRHHSVTVVTADAALPDPSDFDILIIGSPIRMGQMNKNLKKYAKQHAKTISSMPSALFFCCGYPRQFQEYEDTQVPKFITYSLGVHCFGGELKPERWKGWEKLVIKAARNGIRSQDFEESDADHHDLPEILPENIELLTKEIEKLPKDR